MAEFPHIGAHCSVPECRMLDFLPMKCDACSSVLCRQHIQYDEHRCESAHRKNVQVPVCPLCDKPVPTGKNELPDMKVGEHIDRDCKSDPAQKNRLKVGQCSMIVCKKRELVPIQCRDCRRNFCLGHRHFDQHSCQGRRENALLRPLTGTNSKQQTSTENDEALAKALHSAMNGTAAVVDPEELSRQLARQLQEEEYRRAGGQQQSTTTGPSQKCNVS
ncbi:AN1-like zinc finger domain-containing protein [Ditylenchus destructor]|nr:AN1-like zinc finger domain-containing protein [Ditylenchus destructor]